MYKKIIGFAGVEGLLKLLGYLLLPVYLGLMKKGDFGEFGFYFTSVSTLSPLVILGIYVPQIREYINSKSEDEKKLVFTTGFVLSLTIATAIILLLNFSGVTEYYILEVVGSTINLELKSLVFSLLVIVQSINLTVYSHLIAYGSKSVPLFNTFRFFVVTAMSIGMLYYSNDGSLDSCTMRMTGWLVGELIVFSVSFFIWCKSCWRFDANKIIAMRLLKSGLAIFPSSLAVFATSAIDRFYISSFHGHEQLADFNLTLQILAPLQMLIAAIQVVWAPRVYEFDSMSVAYNETKKLMKIVSGGLVAAAAILMVIFHYSTSVGIIPLDYKRVDSLLPLFILPVVFGALQHLFYNLMVKFKKELHVTIVTIIGTLLSICIGYLLTIPYGIYGASASVFITNIFCFFISLLIVKKYIVPQDRKIYET